jgi:hypothetical protein
MYYRDAVYLPAYCTHSHRAVELVYIRNKIVMIVLVINIYFTLCFNTYKYSIVYQYT